MDPIGWALITWIINVMAIWLTLRSTRDWVSKTHIIRELEDLRLKSDGYTAAAWDSAISAAIEKVKRL